MTGRWVEWSSRLLGRTRRQRTTAIAVILLVSGGLGLLYSQLFGDTGVLLALAAGALFFLILLLLVADGSPTRRQPPWDSPWWKSTHTQFPIACALCGFPCLGGFYIEAPHWPGVFIHSISCGPALHGVKQLAEPTHERGHDGQLRLREA